MPCLWLDHRFLWRHWDLARFSMVGFWQAAAAFVHWLQFCNALSVTRAYNGSSSLITFLSTGVWKGSRWEHAQHPLWGNGETVRILTQVGHSGGSYHELTLQIQSLEKSTWNRNLALKLGICYNFPYRHLRQPSCHLHNCANNWNTCGLFFKGRK